MPQLGINSCQTGKGRMIISGRCKWWKKRREVWKKIKWQEGMTLIAVSQMYKTSLLSLEAQLSFIYYSVHEQYRVPRICRVISLLNASTITQRYSRWYLILFIFFFKIAFLVMTPGLLGDQFHQSSINNYSCFFLCCSFVSIWLHLLVR